MNRELWSLWKSRDKLTGIRMTIYNTAYLQRKELNHIHYYPNSQDWTDIPGTMTPKSSLQSVIW